MKQGEENREGATPPPEFNWRWVQAVLLSLRDI